MARKISDFFISMPKKRSRTELEEIVDNHSDMSFHALERFMDSEELPIYSSIPIQQSQSVAKKLKLDANLNSSSKCQHCGKQTSSKYTLNLHIRRIHPEVVKSEIFNCKICNRRFVMKFYYENHMKTKHKDGKSEHFECDFDGKVFKTKGNLITHMRSHLPNIKCELCQLELKPSSLWHHLKDVHSKARNFECQTCFKTFKTQAALSLHQSSHDKKFNCEICSKKFRQNYELKKHIREIHENPNSFKCEDCDKTFSTKSVYRTHQKVHEKIRPKPFKCEKCDYASDIRSNFLRHLVYHQRKDERYAAMKDPAKCTKCFALLKDKKSLVCHMYTVHPKDIHQCDLCGMYLKAKSGLIRHINIHIEKRLKA